MPSKDSIQLYFSKQDSGLSSPIDISLPRSADEDKSKAASFLFSCVERIQTLGTTSITIPHLAALNDLATD